MAAGWHAKMNAEVQAHEIWIFRLFSSDLSVQLMVVVQLMVMKDSQLQSLTSYISRFWSNHKLNLWYLWHLCARMYSLTQSGTGLLVMADHRRHDSLGLEQVEAPVMMVAQATAHAMYFQFPLSLSLTSRWRSWRPSWWKSNRIWRSRPGGARGH